MMFDPDFHMKLCGDCGGEVIDVELHEDGYIGYCEDCGSENIWS